MTTIRLVTFIHAPAKRCFDLSLSIDLHMESTKDTGERVVAGRENGLIQLGESVTWEARHFGVRQQLATHITVYTSPTHFRDEMLRGAFKSMVHDHYFEAKDGGTAMTDVFVYETPYGIFGAIFDILLLKRHMIKLLEERNDTIKRAAESEVWTKYLP